MKPTIHFDLRGDYYSAFHKDARDAAPVLGMVTAKLGGADVVGVPRHMIEDAISTLTAAGFSVKFNRGLNLDGKHA